MREDLKVWLSFLSDYNGITVMLDNVWTSNETICLFTDSAGGRDKGFDFEDFLLIIATTAWLSTLKIIRLFFKCIPQMCTEMTTGNNSKNVIEK
jgi:hypothetical protein